MISLEEFLKYMLKKWKLVIAIVAASTVLFTGAMYLFYETVVEETSILQEYYSEQVEFYEEILTNKADEEMNKYFFDDAKSNMKLLSHFREQLRIVTLGYRENVTVTSAAVFGMAMGGILAIAVTYTAFAKKIKDFEE